MGLIRNLVGGILLLLLPALVEAAEVTPERAIMTARNFFQEKAAIKNTSFTKSSSEPLVNAVSREGELVYYIIEFPGQGFTAIAGDDRCTPVLAWSLQPLVPGTEMPEACARWFDWYARQVLAVKRNNYPALSTIDQLWETWEKGGSGTGRKVMDQGVGPLTTSLWGQRNYYNAMCPDDPLGPGGHAIAGCVATAMAQLLYYYRFPVHGEGANGYMSEYGYEYVNFEEAEYRWDEMVNIVYGEVNTEVAELVYHVGVSVEMNYGATSSGAMTEEAADALKNYFRYDEKLHYISKYDLGEAFRDSVIENLNRERIMIYRGGGLGSAHSFICDGYQDSTWLHFNWGWDGNYNGYFTMENLHPGPYDFTFDQGAVINIFPREDYPAFCQGPETLSASKGTFTDGSGPEPYLPGQGCSWLIDPADPQITNVMIWFPQFNTLADEDIVSVYDGSDETAPILGQFSGSELPPLLVSTGSNVLVVFETGNGPGSQGWQAEYLAYAGPFCNAGTQFAAVSINYFTDGSGPYHYTDLSDCGWLISPQTPDYDSIGSVNLDFYSVGLAEGDTLFVHDGKDDTAPLLGKIYGTELPGTILSTGDKLFLNFISDESITGDGWEARYTSNLPVYCQDTVVFTEKTGIIGDGSGDKKYVPNTNCSWMVSTDNTEVIMFEFLEFDLEFGYDQLNFFDASVTPPVIKATYWGHELPPLLSISSDKVLITFTSDESVQFGGWKLKYSALAPGVGENAFAAELLLVPNPAKDLLTVKRISGQEYRIDYELYDISMGLVKKGTVLHNETISTVDVSDLHSGTYFILFSREGERCIRKLIVL